MVQQLGRGAPEHLNLAAAGPRGAVAARPADLDGADDQGRGVERRQPAADGQVLDAAEADEPHQLN
jgi:hypothetical protein